MKFIVNIEPKTEPGIGEWSQSRFNKIISFINPKENTTIVLSKDALTILACCVCINKSAKKLILGGVEYKYVVNVDVDGVFFEYEDTEGFIRTVTMENPVFPDTDLPVFKLD